MKVVIYLCTPLRKGHRAREKRQKRSLPKGVENEAHSASSSKKLSKKDLVV